MWQETNLDIQELIDQFLDVKRNQEELKQRVERLEDEVVLLADQAWNRSKVL